MDQEFKDKRRRATVLLATVVGGMALLLGAYMLTLGRPALTGVDHHDFGELIIRRDDPEAVGEHTFVLTNRTGSPISIRQVTASCGCTATRYAPSVVEPGGTLEVGVTLTLSNNGPSDQRVYIHTAERGMRTLTVSGVGRREQQLRAGRSSLPLMSDAEQTFAVFGEIWPGDLPEAATEPTLSVDGGDLLDVKITRWFEQRPAADRGRSPATWSGWITVRAKPQAFEAGVKQIDVRVVMEDEHVIDFPVLLVAAPAADSQGDEQDEREREVDNDFNPLQFEPGNQDSPDPVDH